MNKRLTGRQLKTSPWLLLVAYHDRQNRSRLSPLLPAPVIEVRLSGIQQHLSAFSRNTALKSVLLPRTKAA
jgi:hypothetical protein